MGGGATAGLDLADAVREARQACGLQQVELARQAGITPSYLSRIEGAAWNNGGPWPSDAVLRSLARALSLSSTDLIDMRTRARRTASGVERREPVRSWLRGRTATRFVVRDDGGPDVYQAAADVIARNPPGGSLRAVTTVPPGGSDGEELYADALRRKLDDDTDTTCLRVAGRPLCADVLIGENEALIAIPTCRARPDLRACVVIDDPGFVRALRQWYDEFVWDPAATEAGPARPPG